MSLKTKLWGSAEDHSLPDIPVSGTHRRENLVDAMTTSNAEEEVWQHLNCLSRSVPEVHFHAAGILATNHPQHTVLTDSVTCLEVGFYDTIIVAFGPYLSISHLQELSRHPDPRPASQVVTRSPNFFVSASRSRQQVFLGRPHFLFFCGSQVRA